MYSIGLGRTKSGFEPNTRNLNIDHKYLTRNPQTCMYTKDSTIRHYCTKTIKYHSPTANIGSQVEYTRLLSHGKKQFSAKVEVNTNNLLNHIFVYSMKQVYFINNMFVYVYVYV